MLGTPLQNLLYSPLQHLPAHPANAEDNIHADIVKPRIPQLPECPARPVGRMASIHPAQHPLVQRLNAHAHPVHAKRAQAGSIFRSDIVRIDLHRPLPVMPPSAGIGNAAHKLKRQHRWGTASKVECIDCRRCGYFVLSRLRLRANFICPCPSGTFGALRKESAVKAPASAEWHMNVDHRQKPFNC